MDVIDTIFKSFYFLLPFSLIHILPPQCKLMDFYTNFAPITRFD